METKKTPKADLENKKGLFAEIGLVAVLFILLGAFNWKSYSKDDIEIKERVAAEVIEETIMQTAENEPPPPPPEPEIQVSQDQVIVREDDEKIKNEARADAEDDQSKGQQTYVPVPEPVHQEEEEAETEIFTFVEDNPEFPGGTEKLYVFLGENVKYPSYAKEANIQGTVIVSFVVEKDGSISNVKVLRDIGGGCGAEAVRVIKEMPKWEPGKQRGKPVRVSYNVPVRFSLK